MKAAAIPARGRSVRAPGVWRRRLTGPAAAAVVLAAFWVFLQASLWDKGLTHDEIVHATGGYTYWRFNDYRIQPENGNLPQRVAALPLLSGAYRFPPRDSDSWRRPDQWSLAGQWFFGMGNDATAMIRRGRAVCGLFAVALGALVWWWSRRLFGPGGGMLSLLLYALNPSILANGALMTSDMAAALFFLVATLAWWRLLHRVSLLSVAGCGLAVGALFLSKMSAPLIVPVAGLLLLVRLVDGRPLPVALGLWRGELVGRGRQLAALAAAAATQALLAGVLIWAAYGFRFSMLAPDDAGADWLAAYWQAALEKPPPQDLLNRLGLRPDQAAAVPAVLRAHGVTANQWTPEVMAAVHELRDRLLDADQRRRLEAALTAPPARMAPRLADFLRRHRLLPEAFVYGYACVWQGSQDRPAFMNGRVYLGGSPWFFPYTFLVKTPLPVFAVMLLALVAAAMRWRAISAAPGGSAWPERWRAVYESLPLWALWAFYWAAAISSSMNIGHRHILPTYPALFVLCGAAAGLLARGVGADTAAPRRAWRRHLLPAALLVALLALAVEVPARFPNYLAYFNALAGGPAQGYRHLVDSSLDWGQDLPGVKEYLRRHPTDRPVYFSYFGTGSPDWYGIKARPLCSKPGLGQEVAPWIRLEPLPAGDVRPAVAEIRRRLPEYDFVGMMATEQGASAVLIADRARLTLTGGTYLISATLLQPIRTQFEGGLGDWNRTFEEGYQVMKQAVAPLLAGGGGSARVAALNRRPPAEWLEVMSTYEHLRFARLTAWLRHRKPDASIGYSILVYRLSDADVARALDGPPPELQPVPPWIAQKAPAGG
jgi:4-amino-4-deoxy-L-arabinose transferase-like glycosyltransferase